MAYKLNCDHDRCYFCGCQNPMKTTGKKYRSLVEVHHIKERNEGGDNSPSNLVACCSNCHSKIHLDIIKLEAWYNVGYAYKLVWYDEDGIKRFGPRREV